MPLAGMFIRSPITDKSTICDLLSTIGVDSLPKALEYFNECCMTNFKGGLRFMSS